MGAASPAAVPVGTRCPVYGCRDPVGLEVLGDDRHPPRWYCAAGHSGYFREPGTPSLALLLGDARRPASRCCSECGLPVRPPARKCLACRRDTARHG